MLFVNQIFCLSIDENHFFDREDDMGMAESISKLFMQLVERHGGNKAGAARSLGVDPTTFWNWASGKRSFNPALCQAIDRDGGILLIPGDSVPASGETKPQAAPRPQGAASDRVSELIDNFCFHIALFMNIHTIFSLAPHMQGLFSSSYKIVSPYACAASCSIRQPRADCQPRQK